MSSSPSIPFAGPRPRWPWFLPLGASALAVAWFVYALTQRLPYPHELEWMEGALVDHASRVADGLPLYCEPGPEHVPFLYAPMLFWLGGLGMKLGIDGLLTLRLVAAGFSIGSAMLIGHWVRHESGDLRAGLVATGTFVAGYGWLAWWYDLARNDSLFVFCCLATAYQLRHGGARRWLWAGLLAVLAVLSKQSALMWLPAIAVGSATLDWRTAWRFAVVAVVVGGVAFGAMHVASDGWSTFYLFEMPRHHGIVGDRKLGYWTEDLLPMLPLVLLGLAGVLPQCRAGRGREALFLAAFGGGGLMTSWFSRMHVGGFDNVMMYGFAAACVLGPLTAAATPAKWLRLVGPWLLLAQFVWLGERAWQRGTATLLPSEAHRRAHEQIELFVEAQDGPVWIPAHGRISYRAGKGTGAHGQAIFDLLQLLPKLPDGMFDLAALADPNKLAHLPQRAQDAVTGFYHRTIEALARRDFASIVVDEAGTGMFPLLFAEGLAGPDRTPGTDDDPYVRRPGALLKEPLAIQPLLGFVVHSPYALVRR